jgi:hypothetical protein
MDGINCVFAYYSSRVNCENTSSLSTPFTSPISLRDLLVALYLAGKDQTGVMKYNQLVKVVGEDEIINQVLANMNKPAL